MKEKRWRIIINGAKECVGDINAIRDAADQATKSVAQLNEALKELAELRKQSLL